MYFAMFQTAENLLDSIEYLAPPHADTITENDTSRRYVQNMYAKNHHNTTAFNIFTYPTILSDGLQGIDLLFTQKHIAPLSINSKILLLSVRLF